MLFLVNLLKKHKRRAVFTVFCSSLTSETLFFPFSAFRLQAKRCFSHFLHFACERKPVFAVFCSSLASETLFFAFSAFRLQATSCFAHLLSLSIWRKDGRAYPKPWYFGYGARMDRPRKKILLDNRPSINIPNLSNGIHILKSEEADHPLV